jgi:subtilase family serine protease
MRKMLNPLSRPLVAALSTLVLVSGSGAAAASTRPSVTPTLRAVPGSALPALRGAARVAPTAAARPIDVTVSLKPRNASLLAYSARTSSGSEPMSTAQLRALFAPSAADRAAVVAYMRGHGMRLERSGLLTLSFHGTATAASSAFHVGLSTYRGSDGHVFRAPDAAVRLPTAISPLVSSVTGLDTATKLQSLATRPELTPHTAVPTPSCSGPGHAKSFYGGYLPGDLATAYGHRSLIQNGYDGTGESIALVEFSNYKASDISSFKSCVGLTTPVHNRPINGGSTTMSGAIEAELDIEVALSNAPGLDSVEVYTAPNSIAQILPMIDRMISTRDNTHTYIISDSWGLCEDALPPSFLQAESYQLQMAAAMGLSFYAASGDSGSSDCERLQSSDTKLTVDDPASQPFVTGVGGTALHSANGADSTAWKHGGGGISRIWSQPSYQSGNPHRSYDNGVKCGNPAGFCRQVPDIALDARPSTGYIIECTSIVSGCPRGIPWFPVGGTSGGAPLMAAITADANTSSLQNGGHRMGFANPMLYSDPSMFWDVTVGNNSINGSGLYQAAAGYDPATGLGSPKADLLANALAAFTPVVPNPDATNLDVTAPTATRTVKYGRQVTLAGRLTDAGDAPIANRRVYVELREGNTTYWYGDQTDSSGVWSFTFSKQLRRNLSWQAIFPGSDTEGGVTVPGTTIHVIPRLGSRASRSRVPRGTSFTFSGVSTPNMHGARVRLQVRRRAGGAWHTVATVAVNRRGGYSRTVRFTTPGAAYLRWSYAGGGSHAWMSATSPSRHVAIT